MYADIETETSYNYLKQVVEHLAEPICMLGGWAVFFHVNEPFQMEQRRPYLGSRDIDLGIHFSKMSTATENLALTQTLRILTTKLHFKPQGFRLYKEIHTETGKEIPTGTQVPSCFVFPMFVDLIVDRIPKNFQKIFKFDPIDEPLLIPMFENQQGTTVKGFGKQLLLPSVELLVSMKLKALPNRDKEHKRIKDLCDTFALLWYAAETPSLKLPISKKEIEKATKILAPEDYIKAGKLLGHTPVHIKQVMERLG